MTLIADSGSTKTEWVLTGQRTNPNSSFIQTQGINPFMLSSAEIAAILKTELIPHIKTNNTSEIFFYGAGCRPEQCSIVENTLHVHFPQSNVYVASDMLGAARSTCGENAGIVCIMGTGSNSCLYNGKEIEKNIPPLGFILGDEGSGAVLGKRLVADIIKQQLPQHIRDRFMSEYNESTASIIQKVYKEVFPNRYLAHFVPFLKKNIVEKEIQELVKDEFRRFIHRNIDLYGHKDLPVHFVGSIAFHFSDILQEIVEEAGYPIGKIIQKPLEGLVEFHTQKH